MDAFLTTVIAGVVVAIVGGIIAYYFGKRQQRQTQAYEREREEREQLEEKQKERKKQGAEVFGELERQMNSIIDALTEHLRRAKVLPDRQPSGETIMDRLQWDWSAYDVWKPFLLELEALFTRTNEIDKAMTSLRDYYHAHESSLEPTTHTLFASFDEEVISRYQDEFEVWLGENAETYRVVLEDNMRELDAHKRTRVPVLGRLKDLDIDENYRKAFAPTLKDFSEGFQELQSDWGDFQAYRTGLREERAKYNG
jgi:uncharacterized membrane-anchored protein YhcB (DUF1043 family)